MVWFERYGIRLVVPVICLFDEYDESLESIELCFDAYGDLNGALVRGTFYPIPP